MQISALIDQALPDHLVGGTFQLSGLLDTGFVSHTCSSPLFFQPQRDRGMAGHNHKRQVPPDRTPEGGSPDGLVVPSGLVTTAGQPAGDFVTEAEFFGLGDQGLGLLRILAELGQRAGCEVLQVARADRSDSPEHP